MYIYTNGSKYLYVIIINPHNQLHRQVYIYEYICISCIHIYTYMVLMTYLHRCIFMCMNRYLYVYLNIYVHEYRKEFTCSRQ